MVASAEFLGLSVAGAQFTLCRGTSPSSCLLRAAPTVLPSRVGTLILRDDTVVMTFPNARVKAIEPCRCWDVFVVEDRRWMWAHSPRIDAEFNTPRNGGVSVPAYGWTAVSREKSPRDIASFILDAMGETGYDVSAMPNNQRPWMRWESVRADEALAQLCEACGCDVALGADNVVRIVQVGAGPVSIAGELIQSRWLPADTPQSATVEFAPTWFQSRLKLRAVAYNDVAVRPRIIPVEELSWWSNITYRKDLLSRLPYVALDQVRTWDNAQLLTMYQVVSQEDGTQNIPGTATVDLGGGGGGASPIASADQYELLNHQADVVLPPLVSGYFWNDFGTGQVGMVGNPWADLTGIGSTYALFSGEVRVDETNQLVMFDRPMFQLNAYGDVEPCQRLYITTAYKVRTSNGGYFRYSYDRSLGGGPHRRVIGRSDRRAVYATYHWRAEDYYISRVPYSVNNEPDMDAEAIATLDAHQPRLLAEREIRQYGDMLPVSPNGKIRQVRWAFGAGLDPRVATTFVGINCEVDIYERPAEEKRVMQTTTARFLT